jgi:hypothetical protein
MSAISRQLAHLFTTGLQMVRILYILQITLEDFLPRCFDRCHIHGEVFQGPWGQIDPPFRTGPYGTGTGL